MNTVEAALSELRAAQSRYQDAAEMLRAAGAVSEQAKAGYDAAMRHYMQLAELKAFTP